MSSAVEIVTGRWRIVDRDRRHHHRASVEMGSVTTTGAGARDDAAPIRPSRRHLSLGNPHAVVAVDDVAAVASRAGLHRAGSISRSSNGPGAMPSPRVTARRRRHRGVRHGRVRGGVGRRPFWTGRCCRHGNHRAHGRRRCQGSSWEYRRRPGRADRAGHFRRHHHGRRRRPGLLGRA